MYYWDTDRKALVAAELLIRDNRLGLGREMLLLEAGRDIWRTGASGGSDPSVTGYGIAEDLSRFIMLEPRTEPTAEEASIIVTTNFTRDL